MAQPSARSRSAARGDAFITPVSSRRVAEATCSDGSSSRGVPSGYPAPSHGQRPRHRRHPRSPGGHRRHRGARQLVGGAVLAAGRPPAPPRPHRHPRGRGLRHGHGAVDGRAAAGAADPEHRPLRERRCPAGDADPHAHPHRLHRHLPRPWQDDAQLRQDPRGAGRRPAQPFGRRQLRAHHRADPPGLGAALRVRPHRRRPAGAGGGLPEGARRATPPGRCWSRGTPHDDQGPGPGAAGRLPHRRDRGDDHGDGAARGPPTRPTNTTSPPPTAPWGTPPIWR